jgi:hypothetical protein
MGAGIVAGTLSKILLWVLTVRRMSNVIVDRNSVFVVTVMLVEGRSWSDRSIVTVRDQNVRASRYERRIVATGGAVWS